MKHALHVLVARVSWLFGTMGTRKDRMFTHVGFTPDTGVSASTKCVNALVVCLGLYPLIARWRDIVHTDDHGPCRNCLTGKSGMTYSCLNMGRCSSASV